MLNISPLLSPFCMQPCAAYDVIAADIQTRQRPDGGNTISTKVGSGLSWDLLVRPDGVSESDHARSIKFTVAIPIDAAERSVADIQRCQRRIGAEANSKCLDELYIASLAIVVAVA